MLFKLNCVFIFLLRYFIIYADLAIDYNCQVTDSKDLNGGSYMENSTTRSKCSCARDNSTIVNKNILIHCFYYQLQMKDLEDAISNVTKSGHIVTKISWYGMHFPNETIPNGFFENLNGSLKELEITENAAKLDFSEQSLRGLENDLTSFKFFGQGNFSIKSVRKLKKLKELEVIMNLPKILNFNDLSNLKELESLSTQFLSFRILLANLDVFTVF